MVGWLTFGNKKFEKLDSTMRKAIPPLHDVMMALIPMVDADTDAFTEYMVSDISGTFCLFPWGEHNFHRTKQRFLIGLLGSNMWNVYACQIVISTVLVVPMTEHHRSSFKCRFLNIFCAKTCCVVCHAYCFCYGRTNMARKNV